MIQQMHRAGKKRFSVLKIKSTGTVLISTSKASQGNLAALEGWLNSAHWTDHHV